MDAVEIADLSERVVGPMAMKRMNFKDRWVLVTGASSGLGRAMAVLLAKEHHANLILVARRMAKLEELKAELAPTGVQVELISADLSKLEDVDRVYTEATRDGRHVYGGILNAGVTHFGRHEELSWEGYQTMLSTNVTGVTRLTMQLIPHLRSHNLGGGVMLVSSMAGLTPVGFQSVYSATKAFLVHFGCSLAHELEGENLSLTVFAPGGIISEMTSGDRFKTLTPWLAPVDKVARGALSGFAARKYLYVPGFIYGVGSVLLRLLPRRFAGARVSATYRNVIKSEQRQARLPEQMSRTGT